MWIVLSVLAALALYFWFVKARSSRFLQSVNASVRYALERDQPREFVEAYMNSFVYAVELKSSFGRRSALHAQDHLVDLFHRIRPDVAKWVAARYA